MTQTDGTRRRNQYTNKDWSQIPFERLSRQKKRSVLLQEANYVCSLCLFSRCRENGASILEIDHIDGNPANNAKENLRVLCPNCHALTPNYKNWGKGKQKSTRFRSGNTGYKEEMERRQKLKDEKQLMLTDYFRSTVTRTFQDRTINYAKSGWVTKLAKELSQNGVSYSSQLTGRKIREFMYDFYIKECFRSK
jgi:hypothetical protein